MKKLIVVEGRKNSGKTSSIKKAAILLGCGITKNIPADIFIIVTIKIRKRKYKIGIASSGDTAQIIKNNMYELCLHELDYIITACRVPGVSMKSLKQLTREKGAELVSISCPNEQNATPDEISRKIEEIAGKIRSQIPE